MGRGSFGLDFDVNRSTFDENMCEKLYIFVLGDLELDLLISNLFTYSYSCKRDISTKLEVSTAFPFRENWRHETDRQTDRMQHLMRPLVRAA